MAQFSFDDSFDEIEKELEKFVDSQTYEIEDLFTDSFVQKHTSFSSYSEMIEQAISEYISCQDSPPL